MKLTKRPRTNEEMEIELHHYLAKLENKIKNYRKFKYKGHEVRWLDLVKIKKNIYGVAPNIIFLIEKGDIK